MIFQTSFKKKIVSIAIVGACLIILSYVFLNWFTNIELNTSTAFIESKSKNTHQAEIIISNKKIMPETIQVEPKSLAVWKNSSNKTVKLSFDNIPLSTVEIKPGKSYSIALPYKSDIKFSVAPLGAYGIIKARLQ